MCGFLARSFCVITAKQIVDTGKLSFKFLIDSGVPMEMVKPYFGYYGYAQIVIDGINKHWEICVMKTSEGQVFHSGNQFSLKEFLPEVPASNLLMLKENFVEFEAMCKEVGIELAVHHFDGTLPTSQVR